MIYYSRVIIEYGILSYIFGNLLSPFINSIIIDNNGVINNLNLEITYSDILIDFINMDLTITKNNIKYFNVKPEKNEEGKFKLCMCKYFKLENIIMESSTINLILVNDSNECIFGLVKIQSKSNKSMYMYTYDDEYFTDRDCYQIIQKIVTNRYE